MYDHKLKLLAYFAFALCFNLVCTTNGTQMVQHLTHRHNVHQHHHNQQQNQHHFSPNMHTKKRVDFYYDSISQTWKSHHNGHNGYSTNKHPNKTHIERVMPSVNTKLLPITSKSPAKSMTNPLKLTLIQTNGHSYVANNYPDAFNTHFYRGPIAPQSPSTDYDGKWRAANNPFASHFNPTIETVPISTASPAIAPTTEASTTTSTTTTTTSKSALMPTATVYRTYTAHREHAKYHHPGLGRHVCVDYKSITAPTLQENRQMPCRNASHCKNSRLNYDHYNTIYARRIAHTIYNCCPGWTKISKHSHGCTKPICKIPCKNNGKCVKPEFCACPNGYTGRHCESDINECETDKPCDQTCYNTEGSYYCTCRLGFILQPDRQSCKKIDTSFGNDDIGTAFEARDLENDVDTDDMDSRINNIEKLMITEKERNVETNKLMHHTLAAVNNFKHRLDSLENRQHELNLLRERLKTYELQTNKLQYTVDLLYKCRHKPLIYCPQ